MKLHPPWSEAQVARLNAWQACGWVHPFTCGGPRSDAAHRQYAKIHGGDNGQLVAYPDGWRCPVCTYRQIWAHDFMFEPLPPNPNAAILED